jgi:hypothetical protein
MGLGQTMLTVAFLVLVTIAAMNANKMIVERDSNYYEQEAYREGAILAKSLLTEIARKRFDERIDTSSVGYAPVSAFSSNDSLGPSKDKYLDSNRIFIWWFYSYYPEPNKVPLPDTLLNPDIPNYKSIDSRYYDDVDDYDGYIRYARGGSLTGFVLNVDVYYVSGSDLNTRVTSKTYYKRIDVIVTNPTYFPRRDIDGDGDDDNVELKFSTIKAY